MFSEMCYLALLKRMSFIQAQVAKPPNTKGQLIFALSNLKSEQC